MPLWKRPYNGVPPRETPSPMSMDRAKKAAMMAQSMVAKFMAFVLCLFVGKNFGKAKTKLRSINLKHEIYKSAYFYLPKFI
jgi:hypothetical protein